MTIDLKDTVQELSDNTGNKKPERSNEVKEVLVKSKKTLKELQRTESKSKQDDQINAVVKAAAKVQKQIELSGKQNL
ncbi:hypothetical protein H9Q08_17525 [Chryseobacterium sp. PS-8]|uniref:Uncharacterized protein n=1 Tax=Chryseobacterium indicum TaxID=2766954 RepID=A0ABS9CAT9_9FLAO|nr:hypothetical protein [Chryseobacterium sp. PS-8]MCF2221090.1 hypothetical protein [Chryseobacterium sp. PS-8]